MNEKPLTEEELRVNGELQALAAELDRVVDGRNPNREAGRELARKYRARAVGDPPDAVASRPVDTACPLRTTLPHEHLRARSL